MGDGLKITKDKRHRSSSSLAALVVEGTRSERKIDVRASIPEVEDHFAVAEARCDELQEKIDLVKALKRKKKLKRRSMTRVGDSKNDFNALPLMTVRTQPKKKISQQCRMRRYDTVPNPTRTYLDPARAEQHKMVEDMHVYNQTRQSLRDVPQSKTNHQYAESYAQSRRKYQDDGDMRNHHTMYERSNPVSNDVACGGAEAGLEEDIDFADHRGVQNRKSVQEPRGGHGHKIRGGKFDISRADHQLESTRVHVGTPAHGHKQKSVVTKRIAVNLRPQPPDSLEVEKPEVELLFNKETEANRYQNGAMKADLKKSTPSIQKSKLSDCGLVIERPGNVQHNLSHIKEPRRPRKLRYRSRRYELPTISSQMKQAGVRYYCGTSNYTNIPFVASKSTAPSHNIGVNIQQVLNGMKIQQPLSGIPLTIAHHMGLRHIPAMKNSKQSSMEPSLDIREVNAIKVGKRVLRLPSYKYMSYSRLLNLYREGEGMVPRFLKAISRPHYFYTSMYNLNTNRDDMDGATSKGNCYSHVAKQSLAEYADLYREFEKLDKLTKEGNYDAECEARKNELYRELAAREENIRRVVHEYRTIKDVDTSVLRASASTAEDGYRHSTFKLNKF